MKIQKREKTIHRIETKGNVFKLFLPEQQSKTPQNIQFPVITTRKKAANPPIREA